MAFPEKGVTIRQRGTRMVLIFVVAVLSLMSCIYQMTPYRDAAASVSHPYQSDSEHHDDADYDNKAVASTSQFKSNQCFPRTYPFPDRYYGLTEADYPPPFLQNATYINGKLPHLLVDDDKSRRKLCRVDVNRNTTVIPIDGTNPSILSLHRFQLAMQQQGGFQELVEQYPNGAFFVSLTFKNNHQCDLSQNSNSYMPKPPGRHRKKEVDLLLVDSNMATLLQTTITDDTSMPVLMDDAKLFLHSNSVWISYTRHDPKNRGRQLLSRLELKYKDERLWASIKGPTISVCCGRNMAAFESTAGPGSFDDDGKKNETLQLVAWLDPLVVGSVNTNQQVMDGGEDRQHLLDPPDSNGTALLRLHGTTGSLVLAPKLNEYVGIGHYHRDDDSSTGNRDVSKVSLYGHHYTHVFFTVSTDPPFRMKQISNEFVLESFGHKGDADIVQFASGLEFVSSNGNDGLDAFLIAYGINDCEAATASVPAETVYSMLQPLPSGGSIHQMLKPIF